ncbi:MAG: transcription initiation factor IIB [Thermoproteota archaeon]|nr:transcription initiation factor IIB [Thermoproteota archaeon]
MNRPKQNTVSIYPKTVCPNCNVNYSNSKIISDPESGEFICSNCGLVLSSERALEIRPEWRSSGNSSSVNNIQELNNNRVRTGMPTSLARHDMGLSTIIGRTDTDYTGNRIAASIKPTIDRLRILDYRTQLYSSTDRSLKRAFAELDSLKDKLVLPDSVVEKTAYIYRKAQSRGMIRGRTVSAMLAAAIYIACREMGTGKTLKDIAQGTNVKVKALSQSYRILITELDIKIPMLDPLRCVAKVANKMKLNERITRQGMNIMHTAIRKEASAGKNPMGLAAAALHIAYVNNNFNDDVRNNNNNNNNNNKSNAHNDSRRSQTSFAQAAGITDVTLRHLVKDLKIVLPLLN